MAGEVVSGVGAGAKRTDLGNVAQIRRNAKLQNAAGGAYRERKDLRSIATATTPTPTAATGTPAPAPMPAFKATDAFAPGSGMLTDGAGYNTPGTAPSNITPNLTSDDTARALAAALYISMPNPYTQSILDSYNDEVLY